MSTVQQIIDYVDRKYPNKETDANKILDLDRIHKRIYVKMSRLKHDFEIYETTSIADQLTYSLPSNCTIDNIIDIKVSQDVTITDSTEWDTFVYAGLKDDVEIGCYYSHVPSALFALVKDGEALKSTGLTIKIFYYKNAVGLSSSTQTPELDENYHDVLSFELISELASQGHNPDTDIANYWKSMADQFMAEIEENLSSKFNTSPTQSQQVEEWW